MSRAIAIGGRRITLELRQFFRDRESALFNFMLPMILLVIFGSVFADQAVGFEDVTFSQYFLAGMIASGILYTSFQNLAIAIPMERDDSTLKRLQGLPMPKASYFVGKAGMVFTAYVAQIIVLLIVGVLFYGVTLPDSATKWFTFVWVSVLGLLSCTLLGIAFSVVPKQGKGASAIVAPIVLVLQFTSGVFFIFTQLPSWMQNFASIFPLKWLTQAMRYVFLPEGAQVIEATGSWELGKCALVLGAWTIGGFLIALKVFRWSARGQN